MTPAPARARDPHELVSEFLARHPIATTHVMRLWVEAEVARLTGLRAREMARRGTPGPEDSMAKLSMAELNKQVFELAVDLLGPGGQLIDSYEATVPDVASVHGGADPRRAFLRTRATSIEGGTSEVLRNILGERVLQLPPEPRETRLS